MFATYFPWKRSVSYAIPKLANVFVSSRPRCRHFIGGGALTHILSRETPRKFNIFVSKSLDPYFNLSLEHYLFQKSHPESTVLLLYINDPCIVIGRNQNPWLEANLALLSRFSYSRFSYPPADGEQDRVAVNRIPIIRRRSGGGTVFHDHGNINYSVICPPEHFKREKYAEMVVSALRESNPRARVNERHDIVLDMGKLLEEELRPLPSDMHRTPYQSSSSSGEGPLKISGSAYKLSRTRALHHGTCLVASKNIGRISRLLDSHVKPYIVAKGVDSVKSPVSNAYDQLNGEDASKKFAERVVDAFISLHGLEDTRRSILALLKRGPSQQYPKGVILMERDVVFGKLDAELAGKCKDIQAGINELQSYAWLYGQTPSFTFSTHPTDQSDRPPPQLPASLPSSTNVTFTARGGRINAASISLSSTKVVDSEALIGQEIHRMGSWRNSLKLIGDGDYDTHSSDRELRALADWLDDLFGMRAHKSQVRDVART